MKKMLAIAVSCITLFSMCSCEAVNTDSSTVTDRNIITEKATSAVEKNLLTVDVVIPASLFGKDIPATDELTEEQKAQGITKATLNADGSVTYTFKRSAYNKFIADLKKSTADSLDKIAHGEQETSIKEVKYNEDFSKITLIVDENAYNNSLDSLSCLGAYLAVSFYQAYAQNGEKCTITIKDKATGKTVDTIVYPDALKSGEKSTVKSKGAQPATSTTTTTTQAPKRADVHLVNAQMLPEDGDGTTRMLLVFLYKNTSDKNSSFKGSCYVKAFQNGVQCQEYFVWSEETDADDAYTEVMPNAECNVAVSFALRDKEHDLQIEVIDNISGRKYGEYTVTM